MCIGHRLNCGLHVHVIALKGGDHQCVGGIGGMADALADGILRLNEQASKPIERKVGVANFALVFGDKARINPRRREVHAKPFAVQLGEMEISVGPDVAVCEALVLRGGTAERDLRTADFILELVVY